MTTDLAHLALVSPAQVVGDWTGNLARIVDGVRRARSAGATLIVLPELAISGYSLGDRALRFDTTDRAWRATVELASVAPEACVVVGLPFRVDDVLYNAVAVLAGGRVVGVVAKENLASGGPEYESRWYAAWPHGHTRVVTTPDGDAVPMGALCFDLPGLGRFGVEICEDAWRGVHPGGPLALAGCALVVNCSASWFVLGKHEFRRRMVQRISEADAVAYAFVSLRGCETPPFVFDGAALVAVGGEIVADGPRFVFDGASVVTDVVVDLGRARRARALTGSWREQAAAAQAAGGPSVVAVPGAFGARSTTPTPAPVGPFPSLAHERVDGPEHVPHVELELALSLGLRDYVRRAGLSRVVVALSGGRDSAMVALLVARANARDRDGPPIGLTTVWMETDNSSTHTRDAARAVAEAIGANHLSVAIGPLLAAHQEAARALTGVRMSWDDPAHDLPLQNVQARVRGTLAWTVANLERALLLTTSNLSEAAVGYCTMDGDTAGGVAPIGGVPKTQVSAWLAWARDRHDLPALDLVLRAPPTAELRPLSAHQTDEADLMPYPVLDRLIEGFVLGGLSPADLEERLWPEVSPHYPERAAFSRDVARFLRLLVASQWKRDRLALSFRVVGFDLDPTYGFRWPALQAGFVG